MSEELENKIRIISEDKDKMEVVLSSVIEGIVAIDKEGRIILFNHALENMIDCSSDRVLGKFHWEIIRNNQLNELLKETLQKGQTLTREITLFSPQEKIFHASANPLTEKNKVWGAAVVLNDITEIKKLEKMRSEFVANVSHELRTPLTSIIGFSDILLEQTFGELNEKQYKYLQHVSSSGKHLLDLINGILDLSKVEAGKMQMSYEYFNVAEVINDINSVVAPLALKKGISLDINIDPKMQNIKADRVKFRQIIYNLASNAIKFTDNKGKITITVKREKESVHLVIKDTGIGIAENDIEKVFQMFFQLDGSSTRNYGGNGLGLFISKIIIEKHNGKIWINSKKGEGTEVHIILPVYTDNSEYMQTKYSDKNKHK